MKILKISALVLFLTLAGCNEEKDAMFTNPQITETVEIDGCQVKYVNRGYEHKSFYLAKCGNTTTTSQNYRVGKTSRTSTVITTEIEALQAEQASVKAKEAAISKLSESEQKLLGIK